MSAGTQTRNSSSATLFNLTRCAILGAMAVVLFYIEIPVVAFYKLDLSTLPAILAGFAMGPVWGFGVMVVKNLAVAPGVHVPGFCARPFSTLDVPGQNVVFQPVPLLVGDARKAGL